jgi:hypothetical protein
MTTLKQRYKKGDTGTIIWNSGKEQKVTIVSSYFSYIHNEFIYTVKELSKKLLQSDFWD